MRYIGSHKLAAVFLLVAALPYSTAKADTLAAPKGAVVLTVTGNIHNVNGPGGSAQFDMAMLEALESHEGTMETPWTEGKVTFKGPLGRALLAAVGSAGKTARITALNDYSASVPIQDFKDHDVIFATRMDGKTMSVREKGPLFLIYPFDQDASLYNEEYFSRSVWQIKSIAVE